MKIKLELQAFAARGRLVNFLFTDLTISSSFHEFSLTSKASNERHLWGK